MLELSVLLIAGDAPWWVFFSGGMAVLIYLHLDCIDGKQARRTKSSSPLGQLFDHGAKVDLPPQVFCHITANHRDNQKATGGLQCEEMCSLMLLLAAQSLLCGVNTTHCRNVSGKARMNDRLEKRSQRHDTKNQHVPRQAAGVDFTS